MSTKFYTLLTDIGAAKLASAAALGVPLKITHMAVGDGGGVLPTPDAKQTALVNEKRRAALNMLYIDPQNSSQIIAEQVIPENEGGWWIREVGLFDESGALIAVGNCPESYKPQLAEGSGRTQTVRMVLITSSTDNITLKIDPAVVLATRKYVDDKALELKVYADDQMAKHLAAPDPHSQYAPKASPTFTGTPKAPTPAAGNNTTQVATTAFVQAALTALINGAPATLDTLKEIAAAINNDPNFSTTINNALALKAPLSSPALTGTPTAPTAAQSVNNTQIATTAFVKSAIAGMVGSAPAALDTLNELAAALGNDPNFATTMLNALAGKQPLDNTLTNLSGKDVAGLLAYLGLPELLNLKRDKTDNRFSTFVFESGRPEDSLWLAYDEQKKQFAIAFKVDGAAKYVYLQNKGGSLALEEQVTAQAILTKLLQVDGSGSGLDADLVRGLPADFGSSPSTNGYQKLPSGMIIQWGLSEITPTDVYVKFPVAFTRPPLFVGESSPGGGQTTSVWTANAITNVGFNATQICVLSNTSDRVLLPDNNATTWLAIGF
ncbi:phage tail protein [Escherichia coli]|uniref:phage tail protein n=2 Tax=Escherichia coli TaxID=562 RepID=UPI0019B5F997|nr:phage tail protein [Escherichia coli]CAD5488101.1 variable tail fiber protein [Escherichia coli]CAD5555506.1 variable tail fiber protein [Escherichia coli]